MAKTETLTLEIEAQLQGAMRDVERLSKELEQLRRTAEKPIDVEVDVDEGKIDGFIADLKQAAEEAERTAKAAQDIGKFAPSVDTSEIAKMVNELRQAGVEFDAITGKAKELGDAVEGTGSTRLKDFSSNAKTARDDTDQLSDSARGANSAMANMVGNAAQDLGALSGVAGSAGVAIGQMAEYASDATLAGEGLGSALGSMAKVALPIAGIAIATQLVGTALSNANKQAEETAKRVEAAVDAWLEFSGIAENVDAALSLVEESTHAAADGYVQLGIAMQAAAAEGDDSSENLAEINEALLALGVVTSDTGPVDFFRILGGELALLGSSRQEINQVTDDLGELMTRVELASGGGIDITQMFPQPEQWNAISEAVSGLSDAFAQSAPNARYYADEVAYAISKGDDEIQIVEALADALIASGKANVANARDTAQGIFDANETIIMSFEDLDDAVDESALEDWATKTLEEAAASSLELAAQIGRIKSEMPGASDFEVWQQLQGWIEDSGYALRDFNEQVRLINFDPMESDQFSDLVADVKDGTIDIAAFHDVVAGLAQAWGISEEAVRNYILQEANKQLSEEGKAADETAVSVTDLAAAYAEINEILAETPDLVGALEDAFGKVDDIFSGLAFDESFDAAFQEALDGLESFGPDLATLAANWTQIIDDGLEIDLYGNVRADDAEFLEKVSHLRDLFQEGVVNEFKQGGRDAAQAFVDAQVAAIQAANPELSLVDIYRLMGLPDDGSIQTMIQPTIDEDARAKAEGILDALSGAGSTDPRIAQIQVALITGEMTPEEALAATMQVYQDWLDGNPVQVTAETDADEVAQGYDSATEPRETEVTGTSNADDIGGDLDDAATDRQTDVKADLIEAIINGLRLSAFLDAVAKDRTVTYNAQSPNLGALNAYLNEVARDRSSDIHVSADNAGNINRIINEVARDRHSTVHVHMVTNPTGQPLSADPQTAMAQLAAEATPAPMALAAPMAAPMAAENITVTAPAETTGRRVPFPTAPEQVTNNYVTVQAAVVGNRYEIERVIAKSLRSYSRLNGKRGVGAAV